MNIKKMLVLAGALAALLPLNANAERMNFAFAQITGLVNSDLDTQGTDSSGDGFGFRGSWIYGPYVFSDIRYDEIELSNGMEAEHATARIGARSSIDIQSPMRLDVYGMLTADYVEVEREIGATEIEFIENAGAGIAVGTRFGPFRPIEVGAEFSYTDLGEHDSHFFTVEGIWNVSSWLGLILEYRNGYYDVNNRPGIDRTDFNVAIRWQFGGDDR